MLLAEGRSVLIDELRPDLGLLGLELRVCGGLFPSALVFEVADVTVVQADRAFDKSILTRGGVLLLDKPLHGGDSLCRKVIGSLGFQWVSFYTHIDV